MLYLLKEKKETYHRKTSKQRDITSKEKLKLVTDNQQQRKRNKTYADVVANITDNSELCYKRKSDNEMSPNKNKKNLRGTV